jgi:Ethanolamine utilization protein EutJ (predicted chaperonin)
LTATGEITYSADKYDGKTHMTGTMDGHPVDMMQTYSGKRVGDCTAQK